MKDDLISREAAIDALSRGEGCGHVCRNAIKRIPCVPSVPLEPLAKWITENLDPRYHDCEHCSEENACYDCPMMTEQQVKEKLEKWMEKQDAQTEQSGK